MIPLDKQAHFLLGYSAFSTFLPTSPWLALSITTGLALGKEIYDFFHKDKHTPDIWDAFATLSGGGLSFFTMKVFYG